MTQTIPETPPDYDRTRIIERPDGFYWQSKDGGKDYGPFATLLEAVQDMQYSDEASSYEPGETVEEAEAEHRDLGLDRSRYRPSGRGGPDADGGALIR